MPPTPECSSLTSSSISIVSTADRVSSLSLRLPEPRLPLRIFRLTTRHSLCLQLTFTRPRSFKLPFLSLVRKTGGANK